jgi:ABC-type branched-subunit amino acid transport system ATPase component
VLLVEHHADLIFDICDHVTVLNLGRQLAAGTPAEIRAHEEVVSAYLGG